MILKFGVVMVTTTAAQLMMYLFVSETVQLALVGSLVPTIAAVGAILIGWWSARKTAQAAELAAKDNTKKLEVVAAEQKTVVAKTDTIIEQGIQIHTLTNSNLTRLTSQLDVANERIKGLEELVKAMIAAKVIADDLSTKKVDSETRGPLVAATATSAPIPVADDKVAELLKGVVTDKLDTLQESVDTK